MHVSLTHTHMKTHSCPLSPHAPTQHIIIRASQNECLSSHRHLNNNKLRPSNWVVNTHTWQETQTWPETQVRLSIGVKVWHTHTHTHMHPHTHAPTHTCTHTSGGHLRTLSPTSSHTHALSHTHSHTHTHIRTHTHTHMHTPPSTHTHMHTHAQRTKHWPEALVWLSIGVKVRCRKEAAFGFSRQQQYLTITNPAIQTAKVNQVPKSTKWQTFYYLIHFQIISEGNCISS